MPRNAFYAIQLLGASVAAGWLSIFGPVALSALALAAVKKKAPKEVRVGLYIRISRDRPTEVSMAVQERDGRNYALMKGWTVVEVYRDRGITASKTNVVRPGYDRMLRDVEAGLLDVVVIWKLDRLGRSVVELGRVAERLKAKKCDLVSMNDSIDTSTPGGRFVYTVLAAVAQLESEQIALRVGAAAEERARNGRPHGGGSRSFGYADDRRTIIKEEKALLLEAARRVLAGETSSSIATDWNTRGIRTPTGKGKWWPAGIMRILMNDQVCGVRRIDGETVKGDWPAIINEKTRARLMERFADPYNRNGKYTHSLLSGLLHCAQCGQRMSLSGKTTRQGVKVRKYRCRRDQLFNGCGKTHLMRDPAERYVRDIVFIALTEPGFRRAMTSGRQLEDLEALHADIVDIEERLKILAAEFGNRAITKPEWEAARIPLAEELEVKQAELRGAEAAAAPDAPDVPSTIPELEMWWAAADDLDRRALVRAVIERVDCGPPTRPGPFDPNRLTIKPRA